MGGKTTGTAGNGAAESIRGRTTARRIGDRLIARLSAQTSDALPSRGQVAVTGLVNGQVVDTVLEPDGAKGHWIALDRALPETADLDEGEAVTFDFTLAAVWPEPEVPVDLRSALAAAPETAEPWEDITPMARWEWVRWVNATKSSATRERRIEASVSKLLSGHRRPCCFDLSSCTDPEVAKSGRLIETP